MLPPESPWGKCSLLRLRGGKCSLQRLSGNKCSLQRLHGSKCPLQGLHGGVYFLAPSHFSGFLAYSPFLRPQSSRVALSLSGDPPPHCVRPLHTVCAPPPHCVLSISFRLPLIKTRAAAFSPSVGNPGGSPTSRSLITSAKSLLICRVTDTGSRD